MACRYSNGQSQPAPEFDEPRRRLQACNFSPLRLGNLASNYLFYTGSYTAKGDTFKGEVLVQRHTSSPDANPLFGGPAPVGIGVTGTFTDTAAVMNGTALVGKASQIFKATLRKLAESD